MAAALAQGAEVNRSFDSEGGRTALIAAAVGVRRPSGPPHPPRGCVSAFLLSVYRGRCWPASSCC